MISQPQLCNENHGFPATEALEQSMSDVVDDSSSFTVDDLSHRLRQPILSASDVGADWFPRFDLSCFDWTIESHTTEPSQASHHQRTPSMGHRRKRKLCTGLVRSLSLPCLPSTLDSSYPTTSETEPSAFRASTGGIVAPSCKKRKTAAAMISSHLAPLESSRHASSSCCGKEAHKGVDWYIGCWVHDHNQKHPASPVAELTPTEQHLLLDCPFPAPFTSFS